MFQVMAEISVSGLSGFGQKIPTFSLEAHEGIGKFEGKKIISGSFLEEGSSKALFWFIHIHMLYSYVQKDKYYISLVLQKQTKRI